MTSESDPAAGDWVDVCGTGDIELEDVIEVVCDGRPLAVYRSPQDTFHATDAFCTHEHARLADGLVMGGLIECPKHNGRFDYRTGAATRVPARIGLCVHSVRIGENRVYVRLS